MSIAEFVNTVLGTFSHQPTADQFAALGTLGRFLADRQGTAVMVMRGSAGTGKTSLASAMVRTLHRLGQKLVLLAPTGRAAKVFAQSAGMPAFTVHRKIYREKTYSGLDGHFSLNDNLHADTLFVVDESSMISNGQSAGSSFGSGCLLDDLVSYVYGGRNCRLMLIGDKAQLPPVGESESPALSPQMLAGYGLTVYECDLNEVVRQGESSGILYNATAIRLLATRDASTCLPRLTLTGFADIVVVRGDELVETIASSYSRVGVDDTIVITRSNKRSNIYNMGIRNQVLGCEERLCSGDLLMVVKNNYQLTASSNDSNAPSFIANGDRCRVQRVRGEHSVYGYSFATALLRFPDYDDYEVSTTVLLDTLTSDAPALTREQQEKLYDGVMADYADLPRKSDRLAQLRADSHFNALQIKYAYAVTCHKAQGGQWAHVYVDQGYMTDDMVNADYFHWLYTAFTRATEKLFLVNWPQELLV